MMRNIARMQDRMRALGVRLRPHVKTPKCIEVARRQEAAGADGITVSTLKEAERFFAAGFADVLYAVAIAPAKLDRVLALRRRGCRLTIIVDSVVAAQAVAGKGRQEDHKLDVMIEIDCDGHRSGVDAESDLLIEIGRALNGGAILKGVMTHAGSSYELDTSEALRALAEQERSCAVRAAERLRAGESVTAACFAVGFQSLSHFIHSFRRAFGTSPSRYEPPRSSETQTSARPQRSLS